MTFSHAILYAINAMLYLAEADAGVPIPCRRIATAGQMPERFLLQVLRVLVMRGILQSTRGVDGGYYLAKPADSISLAEIVSAFDNPLQLQLQSLECIQPNARSKVGRTLQEAAAAAREKLESMTLEMLLERPESAEQVKAGKANQ